MTVSNGEETIAGNMTVDLFLGGIESTASFSVLREELSYLAMQVINALQKKAGATSPVPVMVLNDTRDLYEWMVDYGYPADTYRCLLDNQKVKKPKLHEHAEEHRNAGQLKYLREPT